jgi:uncharacterized membrane protein YebE (DUF533 family)
MIDTVKLLGSLLQQGATPSAQDRLRSAVQRGTGGPLGQAGSDLPRMLAGLFGQGSGGRGFGEMLDSATGMAKRAAQSPAEEMRRNNPAAIGGLGALAGALLGGGRGAVGGGMLAVLGSLAYAALQQQGAQATPPAYADAAVVQRKAMLLLRAMIQAAKADGQIDGREMQRIMGKLAEAGENDEARQIVLQEMNRPVDIEALAREARDQQEAAELYAASLTAIEIDSVAERDYLARLATALELPPEVRQHIHGALGIAP